MIVRCTSHHFFVETIIIHNTSDTSPNITEYLVMCCINTLVIGIMFVVTKFDKVHKFP